MGFGLLLVGCLLLLPTAFQYYYTVPIAAVFLAIACRKLSRVNTPFGWAFYLACGLGACAAAETVLRTLGLEIATAVLDGVTGLVLLLFWVFCLTGVEWVALETALPRLRARAFRQKLFTCLYLVPQILLNFLYGAPMGEGILRLLTGLAFTLMFFALVILVMNAAVVWSAYMWICMPEDAEMEEKPSRFAFVNRYRARRAAREAERMEAQKREQERLLAKRRANQRKKK